MCESGDLTEQAFNDGKTACKNEMKRSDNPYIGLDKFLATQWDTGWIVQERNSDCFYEESLNSESQVEIDKPPQKEQKSGENEFYSFILFPFRLLWNIAVIAGAITLTVAWISFLFGSVIGVILLLIFMPQGFLLPLGLLDLCVAIWPNEESK